MTFGDISSAPQDFAVFKEEANFTISCTDVGLKKRDPCGGFLGRKESKVQFELGILLAKSSGLLSSKMSK